MGSGMVRTSKSVNSMQSRSSTPNCDPLPQHRTRHIRHLYSVDTRHRSQARLLGAQLGSHGLDSVLEYPMSILAAPAISTDREPTHCRTMSSDRTRESGNNPNYADLAAAARTNAQRFLVASMILFRPAALSFRFGFWASDLAACGAAPDCFLASAHLFRCASAMRF